MKKCKKCNGDGGWMIHGNGAAPMWKVCGCQNFVGAAEIATWGIVIGVVVFILTVLGKL